jgi:hypothetical protein
MQTSRKDSAARCCTHFGNEVPPVCTENLKVLVIEMVITILRRLREDGSVIKFGTTQMLHGRSRLRSVDDD